MRNELQRMRNQGMSFEDIERMLNEMKADEQKKAAEIAKKAAEEREAKVKEAKVAPARARLVEALTNYMLALDVVSAEDVAEMDPNEMIEALKEMEGAIEAMIKLQALKEMMPVISDGHRRMPFPVTSANMRIVKPTDDDVIARFLQGLDEKRV